MRPGRRNYPGNAGSAVTLVRRAARAAAAVVLLFGAAVAAYASAGFAVPPVPDTYVTDRANALSGDTETALDEELGEFQRTTGHQVIVYVAPSTGGVPLETWTGVTAQTWKIGRKGKDDGAVLFVFTADRKVRIEVGYGLESSLTDAASSRIVNEQMIPKLRSGDVDGAIGAGVGGMLAAIDPSFDAGESAGESPGSSSDFPDGIWIVLLVVGSLVGTVVVLQIVAWSRYGMLCASEGSLAAERDMRRSWLSVFASAALVNAEVQIAAGLLSGRGGSSSHGFSAGGGSFGGGGASGSW